jgi:hypothetical protein
MQFLGQMFAPGAIPERLAMGTLEGLRHREYVEGRDEDYITSSLVAADCAFNRFGQVCPDSRKLPLGRPMCSAGSRPSDESDTSVYRFPPTHVWSSLISSGNTTNGHPIRDQRFQIPHLDKSSMRLCDS